MDNVSQYMLQIQALDPSASLQMSEYTRKWYVSARIHLSDGTIESGVVEHRETIEEAIVDYFNRLRTHQVDEFIASSYRGERREWRWNGAAFAECTREEASSGKRGSSA